MFVSGKAALNVEIVSIVQLFCQKLLTFLHHLQTYVCRVTIRQEKKLL